MASDLAFILSGPLLAVAPAFIMGAFVMWRINRHGRVFNWPPIPEKPGSPPVKSSDK